MWTITCLLALAGFVSAIIAVMGKCPVTIPVLFATIVQLLGCLPLR